MGVWWTANSCVCPATATATATATAPLFPTNPKPIAAFRCSSSSSNPQNPPISSAPTSSKRTLTISLLSLICFPNAPITIPFPAAAAAAPLQQQLLERYTDAKEGFTLLIPSSWIKVEKAGATALFEDGKGDNVGVVVNPVRLASLKDFGSPQFVADKLIQAERRKESTKDVEAIGVTERSGNGGLTVYEFEYRVDSTRGGMKRIFSAAFIASKKLYLLNIAYTDHPENPIDTKTRMVLEQILHSFNGSSPSLSSSSSM